MLLKDTNNLDLLKHEQLHFDIAEVYTRLCRKKLRKMNHACSNIHALETQARLATWFQEGENLKYDRESNHYKNKAGQEKWNDKVALWLKNLEEFKN